MGLCVNGFGFYDTKDEDGKQKEQYIKIEKRVFFSVEMWPAIPESASS